MLTKKVRFTTQIQAAPETIFDLVADLPNYSLWLPDSPAFGGTVDVEPSPVGRETAYLDGGPVEKPGPVTEFNRPRQITFHDVVQLRRSWLNTDVDACIRYRFEPQFGGTYVERELALSFRLRGIFRLAQPYIVHEFRKENNRTLAALKRYVEMRRGTEAGSGEGTLGFGAAGG